MNFSDSLKGNTFFYSDSLFENTTKPIPSIANINKISWSDNIEKNLKNNILYQHFDKKSSIKSDSLSNKFIISHSKTTNYIQGKKNEIFQIDYFFLFFILLLTILAIIKIQSQKIFSATIKSIINPKFSAILSREGNFFKSRAFIFILIYACFGLGLILYVFFGQYLPIINEGIKILYLVIGFSLLFLIKTLIIYAIGIFFNIKTLAIKYIHQIIFINYYIAIFIFPLAFIYNYFSYAIILYTTIILLCLLFIYRIVKGFLIFHTKFYAYEIFLYLCTIEILPLLLIVKFTINWL